MKELNIKIDSMFKVTNEVATFGSDGTKHRVGSFEGDGLVYIEFLGEKVALYSYEKQKRRNKYSGRLNTFYRYFGRKEAGEKIKNFLLKKAKEENLKIGKNFNKAIEELEKRLQGEPDNLIFKQVFSYKTVSYSISSLF